MTEPGGKVEITLVRSARLVVSMGGRTLLVAPMLGAAGSMPPVEDTTNPRRNPLVGLPFGEQDLASLLGRIDAVLVTHTHKDHWDAAAVEAIPNATPVLCQPEDEERSRGEGFGEVLPMENSLLREHFDEAQMVELTAAIAWENHRARSNHALGMGFQGFSEGSLCLLPEVPKAAR